ncbi:MAG: RNA polymerase sporulation sigma factor SigK [Lachnospiraceae bacterium]
MKSFSQPLSSEEEIHYLDLYRNGTERESKEALDILVERNMRLVAHVMKKYQNVSEDMEDLISYGTIGLIKAVKSYMPDKGSRLATYAAKCIENEVLMLFRSRKKFSREVSLYEPIGTDKEGNEVRLLDILVYDQLDVVESLQIREDLQKLRDIFYKVLSERERDIIAYRYGLRTGYELTQREIGEKLGISRSYVSRMEKRALEKLRKEFAK